MVATCCLVSESLDILSHQTGSLTIHCGPTKCAGSRLFSLHRYSTISNSVQGKVQLAVQGRV